MSFLFPGVSDSLHIRLISAGYVELGPWWPATDRVRTVWRLCRSDGEGALLRCGAVTHALPAGRILLVPPGLDFEPVLERPVQQLYIHFEVIDWTAAGWGEVFSEPLCVLPDPLRDRLAEQLCDELAVSDRLGQALASRLKSLVHLTLADLESTLSAEKVAQLRHMAEGREQLLEVLRFIDEHLQEPLGNGRLAEAANTSESCFIRRFREAMGKTPARYIQDRRVARASKLLISTDFSIDEIAEQCGFANRYYFSRVFAQRVGRPPARYRKDRPIAPVRSGGAVSLPMQS